MSNTPKTDKVEYESCSYYRGRYITSKVVESDFARKLEKQINFQEKEIKELNRNLREYENDPKSVKPSQFEKWGIIEKDIVKEFLHKKEQGAEDIGTQFLIFSLYIRLFNILIGEKCPFDITSTKTGQKIVHKNRKITKQQLKQLAFNYDSLDMPYGPLKIRLDELINELEEMCEK